MWAVGRSRLAFAEPESQHYWSSVGLSRQRTEQKAGKIQGRALGHRCRSLESESDRILTHKKVVAMTTCNLLLDILKKYNSQFFLVARRL